MLRRTQLVFALLLVALGVAVLPASAATGGEATFSLDCAGFTGNGGSMVLDRDNTGESREAFIVSATDGIGNIVYEPVVDRFFVGASISWTGGNKIAWTSAPKFNPITLRVVSRAGN